MLIDDSGEPSVLYKKNNRRGQATIYVYSLSALIGSNLGVAYTNLEENKKLPLLSKVTS
jgi:hypothetical protein